MATLTQVQVILQASSNVVADHATNTFHFYSPVPGIQPGAADNIVDMVADFYSKSYNSAPTLASYLSRDLTNTAMVKIYNLGDPKPRVPWAEGSFTLGRPTSGNPLPGEVALVLSFQATRVSGQSQARRRNRVYIGPLNENANSTSGRPSTGFMGALARAASEMKKASDASLQWQWHTFSPTDSESHIVHDGWIDNAFDTQRRRGLAPTVRTLWDQDTP